MHCSCAVSGDHLQSVNMDGHEGRDYVLLRHYRVILYKGSHSKIVMTALVLILNMSLKYQ